jgi:hypothetical protein
MSSHDPEREGDVPQEEREDRPELDVDSAFAAIVAGWGDAVTPGQAHPWPAVEDLTTDDDGRPTVTRTPPDDPPALPARRVGDDLRLSTGEPGEPAERGDLDDGERFIPPDLPPLPRADLLSRLAWAGVVGGPLFLLIAALFWRDLPELLLLVAVAAFVGGFAALVVRMPRDHDDDDGAVV